MSLLRMTIAGIDPGKVAGTIWPIRKTGSDGQKIAQYGGESRVKVVRLPAPVPPARVNGNKMRAWSAGSAATS